MTPARLLCGVAAVAALSCGTVAAQDAQAVRGVIDYLRPINPDPIIQHSKEAYVRAGCAYCHGVDLRVRNGEATDLNQSGVVAADQNGEVLGPLLRQGIPQTPKLSPMPQYSDLSEREIASIVRWVHYARQQRRFEEVSTARLPSGDAAAGKADFEAECAACHTAGLDFAALRRGAPAALTRQILRPAFVDVRPSRVVAAASSTAREEARARHLSLLERHTPEGVGNLAAYIRSW